MQYYSIHHQCQNTTWKFIFLVKIMKYERETIFSDLFLTWSLTTSGFILYYLLYICPFIGDILDNVSHDYNPQ